jgi:hypothetical protein
MPTIKRELPADDERHGTLNGYNNYGCRCEKCSTEAKKRWSERPRKTSAFTIRGTRQQKGEPNKEPKKPKASKYCSDIDFDYSVLKGAQDDTTALCLECGAVRPELALLYQDEFCSTKCCRLFYNVIPSGTSFSSGARSPYINWKNLGPRQAPLPNTTDTTYTESAASKVA